MGEAQQDCRLPDRHTVADMQSQARFLQRKAKQVGQMLTAFGAARSLAMNKGNGNGLERTGQVGWRVGETGVPTAQRFLPPAAFSGICARCLVHQPARPSGVRRAICAGFALLVPKLPPVHSCQ